MFLFQYVAFLRAGEKLPEILYLDINFFLDCIIGFVGCGVVKLHSLGVSSTFPRKVDWNPDGRDQLLVIEQGDAMRRRLQNHFFLRLRFFPEN